MYQQQLVVQLQWWFSCTSRRRGSCQQVRKLRRRMRTWAYLSVTISNVVD